MDYAEQVKRAYPNWCQKAIHDRVREFNYADASWQRSIRFHMPRIIHAPEFLGEKCIRHPFCHISYEDIAKYAWALSGYPQWGLIKRVLLRHGEKLEDRPCTDTTDILTPDIFPPIVWDALKRKGLHKYSELRGYSLPTPCRYCQIPEYMQQGLRLHNLCASKSEYSIVFKEIEYVHEEPVFMVPDMHAIAQAVARVRTEHPDAEAVYVQGTGIVIRWQTE